MSDEEKRGELSKFVQTGALQTKADRIAAAKALEDAANDGMSGDGDVTYLTYSGKRQRWSLGREKASPDPEALYVVDPDTIVEGFTCWKGGQPVGKHEWNAFERSTKAVPQSALQDHGPYKDGEGWMNTIGWLMFDLDDPTVAIKFTTSSVSGRNVVGALVKEMTSRLLDDEPEIPIVKLDDEEFTAQGNTNGKPLFPVEVWVSREEVEAYIHDDDGTPDMLMDGDYVGAAAQEPEPEPEPEPEKDTKPKRKRAAAQEPEPEPEQEKAPAARRQRRRRAAA